MGKKSYLCNCKTGVKNGRQTDIWGLFGWLISEKKAPT